MITSFIERWYRVLFLVASVVPFPAFAAELAVTIKDTQGHSQKDTVIALVPMQKMQYTDTLSVSVDQIDKHFVPAVMAIRVNTLVNFPNSDDIRHHVYSFSPAKKFELRLYHGTASEPVLFDKPGTVVLGCNIHDSMVGYIYVVDTPYYAITDAQGQATLTRLPEGSYQLEIYHPRMNSSYPTSTLQFTANEIKQESRVLNNLSDAKTHKQEDEFSNLF
ncbi:MAG TPA: methylamine utilization protein [Cellvibrio sp.]|nr:methylamine utilization protein [Cellvibrio sp.]